MNCEHRWQHNKYTEFICANCGKGVDVSAFFYMEDWLRRERGREFAVRIKDDGRCSLLLSWNGRYREFDAPTIHQAIAMLQEQDG